MEIQLVKNNRNNDIDYNKSLIHIATQVLIYYNVQ